MKGYKASAELAKSFIGSAVYVDDIKTREALFECETWLGYGGANLAKDLATCTAMTTYDAAKLLKARVEVGFTLNEIRAYVSHMKGPKEDTVFNDEEVLRLGKLYKDSGIHKDYGVSFATYLHAVGQAITYLKKPTA